MGCHTVGTSEVGNEDSVSGGGDVGMPPLCCSLSNNELGTIVHGCSVSPHVDGAADTWR